MVASRTIKSQLSRLHLRCWVFGRAEAKELRKILKPGEVIVHCAHGYYHGGSGLLVATNERLLLIDKRPFFLNLEEMQYQNIKGSEIIQHMLTATINIQAGYKNLRFKSVSDARLKQISHYINEEIEFARRRFAKALTNSKLLRGSSKPYQNPGWSPHHPAVLPRRRPTKFYSTNRLAPLG